MAVQELQDTYYEILRRLLTSGDREPQDGFVAAGREAAAAGVGYDQLIQWHDAAIDRLSSEWPELTLREYVAAARGSLSDIVAGYRQVVSSTVDVPAPGSGEGAMGETLYRSMSVLGQSGVWDWDLRTDDLFIDPSIKEMLGYRDHEIPNRLDAWSELVHPEDRHRTVETSTESLNRRHRSFEMLQRLIHKNGRVLWFQCRGRTVLDADGKPVRVLGTNTNVTAARLIADEFQAGVDRYHALIETVPYGIQEVDLSGILLYCNSACDRMFGNLPGERIGRSVLDFVPTPEEADELCRYIREHVAEKRTPSPHIGRRRTVDGTIIDVQADWSYKFGPDGEIVGFISVLTDITQRRRYERELQAAHDELELRVAERTAELETSESRWRSVVYAVPDYLFTLDREANITYLNRTPPGIAKESIVGRNAIEFTEPEFRDLLRAKFREVINTGTFAVAEARALGPWGTPHWYNLRYGPILRDGEVVGVTAVATDINDRKQAEASLREAHQLLEAIFNNTQLLIAYLDPHFNFLTANPAWTEAASNGRCPPYIPARNFFDVYPHDELEAIFQQAVDSGKPHFEWAKPFQESASAEQGQTYWDWTLAPVKGPHGTVEGLILTLLDVTHRVLADEAVRKSQERLKAAQRMAQLGNWDWNLITGDIEWSDEMFRILEVDRRTANNSFLDYFDRIHPDDQAMVREAFVQAMDLSGHFRIDIRVVLPSGAHKYLDAHAVVTFDDAGKPIWMSGTIQDVTERKRAEEELRKSESAQRALLNAIPDMIFRIDYDGTILDFIPASTTRPHVSPSEFLGRRPEDVLPPGVAKLCIETRCRTIETGQLQLIEYQLDVDGQPRNFEARTLPGGKDDLLTIVRDVSAQRQAEERNRRHRDELAHVTRLSTMGEMATGMAHELNQPMSGIASYASACLMMLESQSDVPQAETLRGIISKIEAQAQRAGEIIRRLRKLVVRRDSQYHAINLLDAIHEVAELVAADVTRLGVDLSIDAPRNLPNVLADLIQIEQVILNVVRNGLEAMSLAGTEQPKLLISVEVLSRFELQVTLTDNGPGIGLPDVDRVFEQFYSTKSEGMGMGLSISKTIIEAHGGRMDAANNPAGGARFRFTLPIIQENRHD